MTIGDDPVALTASARRFRLSRTRDGIVELGQAMTARAKAVFARDAFLSPWMGASIGAYLLVAASYIQARVTDDGVLYYDFMRHVVGEDVSAYAYQFGVVFWNLPFYLLFRGLQLATGDDSIAGQPIGIVSVSVASTAAVLAIFYVSWRLLSEFGLPGAPGAILVTVLGSPLFYYAIFQPGLKHAFDALLATILALLLLRASASPHATRLGVEIGIVVALLITIRYANITLLAGVLYVFLRNRALVQAYVATATAVLLATLILLVPLALGLPYGLPPAASASTPARHLLTPTLAAATTASTSQVIAQRLVPTPAPPTSAPGGGVDSLNSFQFDPLAPAKMLFTLKRGLFVWTPVTLFGVAGYFLLIRRLRERITFLVGLGLSCLSLLLVHMIWGGFWEGGYSFSQRFLTDLFPLFVIGIAELLRRAPKVFAPLLVACILWTGFLAVHHFYGYDGVSQADGVGRIVDLYRTGEETPATFWHKRIADPVGEHWRAYFNLLAP